MKMGHASAMPPQALVDAEGRDRAGRTLGRISALMDQRRTGRLRLEWRAGSTSNYWMIPKGRPAENYEKRK